MVAFDVNVLVDMLLSCTIAVGVYSSSAFCCGLVRITDAVPAVYHGAVEKHLFSAVQGVASVLLPNLFRPCSLGGIVCIFHVAVNFFVGVAACCNICIVHDS
jgi:hypothetical protein